MQLNSGGRTGILEIIKKISLSLSLLLLIFVFCLACLFALADMVFEDRNLFFDEKVFSLIHPHINTFNTGLFSAITFFGSVTFLLPANLLLICWFLFFKKGRREAWKITAISITSTLVLLFLKNVLKRERPLVPLISKAHDYSFPSGHTFSSVVFYGMLAFIIYKGINNKIVKWMFIIALWWLIAMVGFSRVYLRMHYASDVIAGFCLGIIWLLLANWIMVKTAKRDSTAKGNFLND